MILKMSSAYYFHGNPIRFYFKEHNCPICNKKLKIKMHHKVINSKSKEIDKYYSLFEADDGGRLIGNFDCDVKHKLFYCDKCKVEIENKTLFSYEDMVKGIDKISKYSKSNYQLDIKYLLDNESIVLNVNNPLKIKNVSAIIIKNEIEYSFIIYDSKFKTDYAEEKYFVKTNEYKKLLKTIKYKDYIPSKHIHHNKKINMKIPKWLWWIFGGILVVSLFLITILLAGGLNPGINAILSAMDENSSGSIATNITSYAFLGGITFYFGLFAYHVFIFLNAKFVGSTYKKIFNSFLNFGNEAFLYTLLGSIIGGIIGAFK